MFLKQPSIFIKKENSSENKIHVGLTLTLYFLSIFSQNKLDEALLTSGRVADALSSMLEWLGKIQSSLAEDQPILGDLDTVSMLIEQHKVRSRIKLKLLKEKRYACGGDISCRQCFSGQPKEENSSSLGSC